MEGVARSGVFGRPGFYGRMVVGMKISHIIGGVLDTVVKVVLIAVIVVYAYKYALEAYNFGYRVFAEEPVSNSGSAKVISIYIPENATAMEIGEVLEENGLIKDARLFLVQELLSGHHDELREGKYELSSDMTPEEMIKVLTADTGEGEEEAAGTSAENGGASGRDGTEDDAGDGTNERTEDGMEDGMNGGDGTLEGNGAGEEQQ